MTRHSDMVEIRTAPLAKVVATMTGVLTIALGLIVLVGWHADLTTLKQVHRSFAPMQYNTCLGFVLSGTGLLLLVYKRRIIAALFGSIVAVIGVSTLVQYIFDVNLGIDQLLMEHDITVKTVYPGRMALNTAFAFLLAGGSLSAVAIPHLMKRRTITLVPLATVIFSLGVLALVGYVANIETAHGWGSVTAMGFHTAAGFIALGVGIGAFGWGRLRTKEPDMDDMRRSIIAYATVGVLLMGLFSALVQVLPLYDQLRKSQQDHLSQFMLTKIARIEQYLSPVRSVAQQWTNDSWTRNLWRAFHAGRMTHEAYVHQTTTVLEEKLARSTAVVGITRLDQSRRPLASVGRLIPPDSSQEHLAQGTTLRFTGPVMVDESFFFVASAGLVSPDGTQVGTDLLLVDMTEVQKILSERIGSARTQEAFLGIRQETGVVVYSVPTGSTQPILKPAEGPLVKIVNQALNEGPGISDLTKSSDTKRLLSFGPVRNTNWVVIATTDMNETYAAPNRQLMLVLTGAVLLSLLGAFGMFFLLRPLTLRIGMRTDDLEQQVRETTIRALRREQQVSGQLRRHAEELERSNIELQQFAYVASHDLREPLRMVASYTQLIQHRYEDKLDQEGKQFMNFAVEGAHRMQSLVNDLLAYSRVETRSRGFAETDCNKILDMTKDNLKASLEESGAVVTSDPLPMLHVDGPQLMQVFQNLIGNAMKFRGEDPPRIHIWAKHDDRDWVFGVRDNGIGIDPEHLERIFQIFKRLQPREKYPGTGIGLSICRRIVERHGGKIWVESQPGQGSTFYFTIAEVGASHEHR